MRDDLFNSLNTYPHRPGTKAALGTSSDAAIAMTARAPSLRDQILGLMKGGSTYTPDEMATALDKSVLAIRPRFSELLALGHIHETGATRYNASGLKAKVYRRVM